MTKVFGVLTVIAIASVAIVSAQENETLNSTASVPNTNAVDTPSNAVVVSVTPEGKLVGKVFQNVDDNQKPVTAKLTISKLNGETIATSESKDDGTFEFDSVEPGQYTIVGVGPGYYGNEVVDVKSHGEAYTSMIPLQVDTGMNTQGVYSTFQNAPISTFSSTPISDEQVFISNGYSSGGGFSSGGGRRIRGRGLRSLLPFVGLVGLVGIDGDDDASPTL